ncbi:hypothetical protein HXX76_015083 [Chlamydomonas incerta]|uniref:Uncharacterized protein n=1 Tax=Chlamydomonas incerta TaxID=51695 RepID=A0A835SHU0_CHLIN|nr:hypothetical protein HXX76_015083 [Chlamydomonas incerta]|eukprot:KAG2423693.1 hypothetical protein HXX76_015083 [Chlamydomonas incerta]
MPWPGREFVLQWGRPEPWRKLPLPQRERLLCLAASSGHVPSLEASLQHGGCALKAEVLQSAAGSGNLAGCKRLIDEGCSFSEGAVAAAAQGGHLVVLQLLLEVAGRRLAPQCITAAAHAACLGNQRPVLEWLESAHGYRPGAVDVQLAAWAGHVALMEQMMPLSPEYTPGEVEDGYSGMEARRRLLMAIADGCPVEVLRRHFRKLWYSYSEQQRRQAEDAEAGTDPEAGADAEEAVPLAAAFEEEEEDEDAKARRAIGIAYGLGFRPGDPGMSLLSTVISSATPCWPSKLRFLLSASAWGPELARAHIRGVCEGSWANVILGGAAEQPDFLQRLKRLRVAGMRLDREIARAAVATAARHGHADALVYLWDECGVSPDPRYAMTKVREGSGTPRHVAVLQLLRDRGAVITARDLSRVDYGRWPEAVVLELIREAADRVSSRRGGAAAGEAADEETSMSADEAKGLWTFAFAQAARSGASQRVLAALRGRGAAIDLGAVAVGGGEEALTWAATELQAERGADESKPVRFCRPVP